MVSLFTSSGLADNYANNLLQQEQYQGQEDTDNEASSDHQYSFQNLESSENTAANSSPL